MQPKLYYASDITLAKIGRALDTDTTVKHAIKRIDRLLVDWSEVREQQCL
ncbi:hypothetical protein ACT3QV_002837 [Vibrio alginolyticus]